MSGSTRSNCQVHCSVVFISAVLLSVNVVEHCKICCSIQMQNFSQRSKYSALTGEDPFHRLLRLIAANNCYEDVSQAQNCQTPDTVESYIYILHCILYHTVLYNSVVSNNTIPLLYTTSARRGWPMTCKTRSRSTRVTTTSTGTTVPGARISGRHPGRGTPILSSVSPGSR